MTPEENTQEKHVEEGAEEAVIVPHDHAVEPVVVAKKNDRILPISILVAAVMIAGALVFATLYKGNAAPATGNSPATGTTTTPAPLPVLTARDAILGNASAPVTLVEYGDYQCPFCAQYFSTLQPQLVSQYVNTGKVKMVFRDFPFLGPESVSAAEAAQCAEDQNALWAYHDALYKAKLGDDAKGGSENDGFFTRAVFMNIAAQVHINTTQFANCIDNNTDANIVTQEKSDASASGVTATPTTFVNGRMIVDSTGESVGADPTSVLTAVNTALAAAQ